MNVGAVAETLPLDIHWLMDEQIQVIGSNWFTAAQGQEMAELARAGLLDMSVFEHHRFPLEEVNNAISGLADRNGGFSNYVDRSLSCGGLCRCRRPRAKPRNVEIVEGLDAQGGVLITSAPNAAPVAPGPSFDVLRQIREDIVSGVFEPNERLKFEDLRDRYRPASARCASPSASPVRGVCSFRNESRLYGSARFGRRSDGHH